MKLCQVHTEQTLELQKNIISDINTAVDKLKAFILEHENNNQEVQLPFQLLSDVLVAALEKRQQKLINYVLKLAYELNTLECFIFHILIYAEPFSLKFLLFALSKKYHNKSRFEKVLYQVLNQRSLNLYLGICGVGGAIENDGGEKFEIIFDELSDIQQKRAFVSALPFDALTTMARFGKLSLLKKLFELLPENQQRIALKYDKYVLLRECIASHTLAPALNESHDNNKFGYLFNLFKDDFESQIELLIVCLNLAIAHDDTASIDTLLSFIQNLYSDKPDELNFFVSFDNYIIFRTAIYHSQTTILKKLVALHLLPESTVRHLIMIANIYFGLNLFYIGHEYISLQILLTDAIEDLLSDEQMTEIFKKYFQKEVENARKLIGHIIAELDDIMFSKQFLYLAKDIMEILSANGKLHTKKIIDRKDISSYLDEQTIKTKLYEEMNALNIEQLWEKLERIEQILQAIPGRAVSTLFPMYFVRPTLSDLEEELTHLLTIQMNEDNKIKELLENQKSPILWSNNLDMTRKYQKHNKVLSIDGNAIHKKLRATAHEFKNNQKISEGNIVVANIGVCISTKSRFIDTENTEKRKYNSKRFLTFPVKMKRATVHVKHFFENDNNVAEIPDLFWQHYKRDKAKANALLGFSSSVSSSDKESKVICHSEQALAEAFEMTDDIFNDLKDNLKRYLDQGLLLDEIYLDIYSTNQVCINCQKRLIAMQNSHEEGFLKKFKAGFEQHFILPSDRKLRLIVRVSADKIFTEFEFISGITPDSSESNIAKKSKVVEAPEASLRTKLKEDFDLDLSLINSQHGYRYPAIDSLTPPLNHTTGHYPEVTIKTEQPIDSKQLNNKIIIAAPIKTTQTDLSNGKAETKKYSFFLSRYEHSQNTSQAKAVPAKKNKKTNKKEVVPVGSQNTLESFFYKSQTTNNNVSNNNHFTNTTADDAKSTKRKAEQDAEQSIKFEASKQLKKF